MVRHDKAALSRALERILREAELRARLAAGCAVVTSRLGWEEPVRDMEALYTTLASQQAPHGESKRVE